MRTMPLSLLFAASLGPLALAGPPRPGEPAPFVGDWSPERTVFRPVPLARVKLGGFLGRHVEANDRASLLAGLESPIPAAFEARDRGEDPPASARRLATDSDFYKWIEGASYAVAYDPSLEELSRRLERYARIVASLQEPDGYLGTRISPAKPFEGRVSHDLYVAGHFFEAAVAHFKATGRRTLIDAARRLADFYLRASQEGNPYFERVGTREHPEIELALVRLSRATRDRRYLAFAADIARRYRIGPTIADTYAGAGRTHAVRLCYLLAGAAEIYMETGDEGLLRSLLALWEEIVSTRMYVTGGIGYNERVPVEPYDLPPCLADNPNRDIAETCASVALMMFSWRLHAITGASRPMDVVETILYNHYLGAIARDHLGNFYYNPLRCVGDVKGRTDHGGNPVRRTRLPAIHSTACCLPNAWRFFAELPEYAFGRSDDGFAVDLYTDAVARGRLSDGTEVRIEVETRYPIDGDVSIRIAPDRPVRFVLRLRIPLWCEGARVAVAGGPPRPARPGTYHVIDRRWQRGDAVAVRLPMRPVALASRPEIEANRGRVAFRRGPLVYCLERPDAAGLDLERAVILLDPDDPSRSVTAAYDPHLGFHVLTAWVGERRASAPPREPYFPAPPMMPVGLRDVRLIPFFFRANRDPDTRWITFIPFR